MEVSLKAEARADGGKGPARRLRADGKIPAVLYGRGMDPVAVSVDRHTLTGILHTAGRNALIDLEVGGETHLTLARELQRDALRGDLVHVDFVKIDRNQAIHIDVAIHLTGEAKGVKEGGVVEHHLWQVAVECLPTNVPERIEADVTALSIGDSLRVEGLPALPGVTILTPAEEIVVSVVVPQVLKVEEEVAEAVEGEEAAEGAEAPEGEPAEGAEGGDEG